MTTPYEDAEVLPGAASPPRSIATGVVSVGLPIVRPEAGQVTGLAVPLSFAGALEPGWLDAIEALLEQSPITVVCLAEDRAKVARAVSLTRQLIETSGIAVVGLASGPLAAAVVADAAAAAVSLGHMLTEDVSRFCRAAPAATIDLAIVSSVASLEVPGLRLSHHLASYLPGRTSFLVQLSPVRRVDRLKSRTMPEVGEAAPFDGPPAVTVMGGEALPPSIGTWLRQQGLAPSSALPSTPLLTDYWHDESAVEIVVHPADLSTWVERALGSATAVPPGTCDWCGAPGLDRPDPGVSCPFCGQASAAL